MHDAELRALDIALAKALGYTVYHYDKDYRENCYYCLMSPDFDPVVMMPFRAGERKTEEEAWEDTPRWSSDHNAVASLEDEIDRRGLRWQYLHQLINAVAPFLCNDRYEEWGYETQNALWQFLRATPEQRCCAALRTLEAMVCPESA